MKVVKKHAGTKSLASDRLMPWRVLVVDDDPDIHAITQLNLRDFMFDKRGIELISAHSAAEAREILKNRDDIACSLVDVIMESDDAGLKLVDHIRGDLRNNHMRVIIRTGQAGAAVEKDVIENYDIDDFKDKTELTAQKLYTTVRAALKGYRDLRMIEKNRLGLEHILKATPGLYNQQPNSLNQFFEGILTQIIALCRLANNGMIVTVNGFVTTMNGQNVIRARSGKFSEKSSTERAGSIEKLCTDALKKAIEPAGLPQNAIVVPLRIRNRLVGYIYLEEEGPLNQDDHDLIKMFAEQSMAALEGMTTFRPALLCKSDSFISLVNSNGQPNIATCNDLVKLYHLTRKIAEKMETGIMEARSIAESAILFKFGQVVLGSLKIVDFCRSEECDNLFSLFLSIAEGSRMDIQEMSGISTEHRSLATMIYPIAELIVNNGAENLIPEELIGYISDCKEKKYDRKILDLALNIINNESLES